MVCLAILSMAQKSLQAVTFPPFECTTCGDAKVAGDCDDDDYDGQDDCHMYDYVFEPPKFDYNFQLVTSDEDASTYNCTILTVTCSGYGGVVLYGTGWNFEDATPVSSPVTTDTSSDMSQLLTVQASFLCLYHNYVPKTQLSHVPTIKYEKFLCKVLETEPPEIPSTLSPSTPEPSTLTPSTPAPSTPSTPTPSTPTQSTPTPSTGTLAPTTTTKCCPLKGIWSDWDEGVSPCSDTCGGCGTMTRRRRCLSQSYGCKCTGPIQQTFPCAHNPCPSPRPSCCPSHPKKIINNVTKEFYCGPLAFGETVERTTCCDPAGQGWNLWAAWSPPCPETCGNCGLRTRSRTCASEKYGCPCKGNSVVSMHCNRPMPCVAPKPACCPPSTLKRVNGVNTCVF